MRNPLLMAAMALAESLAWRPGKAPAAEDGLVGPPPEHVLLIKPPEDDGFDEVVEWDRKRRGLPQETWYATSHPAELVWKDPGYDPLIPRHSEEKLRKAKAKRERKAGRGQPFHQSGSDGSSPIPSQSSP